MNHFDLLRGRLSSICACELNIINFEVPFHYLPVRGKGNPFNTTPNAKSFLLNNDTAGR
jgi:hypothetical protein